LYNITRYCHTLFPCSDLAVDKITQGSGNGKKPIERVIEEIRHEASLLFLSVHGAIENALLCSFAL